MNAGSRWGSPMPSLQKTVKDLITWVEREAPDHDALRARVLSFKTIPGVAEDDPRDVAYRNEAKNHAVEGELEVDDDAIISWGDDGGAYVQGWIWISDQEAGLADVNDEDDAGDDVCDICMRSNVHVSRVTEDGRTIGVECGCDERVN